MELNQCARTYTHTRTHTHWYLIGHWACCHLSSCILHNHSSILADMHFLFFRQGGFQEQSWGDLSRQLCFLRKKLSFTWWPDYRELINRCVSICARLIKMQQANHSWPNVQCIVAYLIACLCTHLQKQYSCKSSIKPLGYW